MWFESARDEKRKREKLQHYLLHAPAAPAANGKTMEVFDGDMDKALAAFIIANGAAAMGRAGHHVLHVLGAQYLKKTGKAAGEKVPGRNDVRRHDAPRNPGS